MDIHIRRPVEYEKIIDGHQSQYIELTRHRMAVQQLLDSKDNNKTLMSRLEEYVRCFDAVRKSIDPAKKLQQQPRFHWVIDNTPVQSSCWKFEAIVPRIVLSDLLQAEAQTHIENNQYVDASKCFQRAQQQHRDVLEILESWSWKIPSMNHAIVQKHWNVSMVHHLKSMQHLCMISVGLDKEMPSKTLYTVAQRATASAVASVAFWPTKPSTLKLCESLQHLFSSHILWDREEYGGSIERLQTRFGHAMIPTFGFTRFDQEFEKVPFLLQEREQVNNGAYFDLIEPATPLPRPHELIYMGAKDVPHPQSTRNNRGESALGAEHGSEPTTSVD